MIPKLHLYKKAWNIRSTDEIKPGLANILLALEKLGNPERQLVSMHVAGTNGKGSTIAFMESVLREHNYSVGVFSSPAIIDIHDQIRIDGKPIMPEQLHESFEEVSKAQVNELLTDFELLTAVAFVAFKRAQVDYVLVETGMGGTLDSTNVITPLVSVITSIALDHQLFLGDSIEAIAKEKAGIIKLGVPVVVGKVGAEALQVISERAEERTSELFIIEKDMKDETNYVHRVSLQMKGPHQQNNAILALKALRIAQIPLTEKAIIAGLQNTSLAHRFEEITRGIYLDGAHNPAAARQLRKTIEEAFPGEKVDFIIGMLKGKDHHGVFEQLIPVAASFTFISFDHKEAESAEQLLADCPFTEKSVVAADELSQHIQLQKHNVVITGSLYLLAKLFHNREKFIR